MKVGQSVRVASTVAPLLADARASAEQISQRLCGHWVTIIQDVTPWLRVRGEDGYEGWVHVGYLREPAPGETLENAPVERISLGCAITAPDGGRRRTLPFGAMVPEGCIVRSGEAMLAAHMTRRFPREGTAVARTAVEFFAGTPYQWGGITPWGADCSGLVQSCFGLHGLALPRDAWQQAERGVTIAAAPDLLEPGDLLFFSDREDGRVTHVAIAIGDARLVHLALGRGGYSVERLDGELDPYVEALLGRFCFARRLSFS